jgi:hypothetical protein
MADHVLALRPGASLTRGRRTLGPALVATPTPLTKAGEHPGFLMVRI